MKPSVGLGVAVQLFVLGAFGCGGGGGTPADGSASADESSSVTAEPTTTTSQTAGESTAADSGSNSNSNSNSDTGTSSSSDGGAAEGHFDLGVIPDTPEVACGGKGGGGGGVELSYIWISNTAQNTISKIDTLTMEEEGRYQAKVANGDPSRTSVNLEGDVAVANRNGGVAKFWADPADCVESNGSPGIQTSSGNGDVLPWDEEECRAWNHEMVCGSNRPVAWTRGEWNEATCSYIGAKLWTVCDNNVLLLDGETGETEQTIIVPGGNAFVYGGAADADGNFWGLNTNNGSIFRVDGGDYSAVSFPLAGAASYGITVDPMGRPWTSGGGKVSRFDIETSTWTSSVGGGGGIGGCMTDGESTIWHDSGSGTLLGFDLETLDVVHSIPLPEYVHGVSVDFQGRVWGVSFAGSNAYRADPVTGDVETFNQLVGAYTYSDMTGFALNTAGGGGVPPT